MRITQLLLVVLVTLSGCTSRAVRPHSGTTRPPWGFMTCQPPAGPFVAWVQAEVLFTKHASVVVAHEMDHLMRARAMFRSCAEWTEWIKDPINRLTFEAVAYCASVKAAVAAKLYDENTAYATYAQLLAHETYEWPGEVTTQEAEDLIRLACRDTKVEQE